MRVWEIWNHGYRPGPFYDQTCIAPLGPGRICGAQADDHAPFWARLLRFPLRESKRQKAIRDDAAVFRREHGYGRDGYRA